MQKLLLILACAALLPGAPALAAVAQPSCEAQTLTPDQRAAISDLVFEGAVKSSTCLCKPLANDEDTYGPEADCTDVVDVTRPIKGANEPQYTFKNMVMLDPVPEKQFSGSECQDRIDDRSEKLNGSSRTYYMVRNSVGLYESTPKTACR